MKKLLSYLAPAAVVLLASCSSEPSDWRPDKKVSLDMVEPGTRVSDNFGQDTTQESKDGAINEHVSNRAAKSDVPTAGAVMTANTQEGTAMKPGEGLPSSGSKGGSATPDTAQGQANARK